MCRAEAADMQMEEELKAERQEEDRRMTEGDEKGTRKTKKKKKGLRQMVKGLLKGGGERTKNPSPPY